MLAVLKRFAWKPLLKVMEDRHDRIRDEFAEIERQKLEVKAIHEVYEEKLDHIDTLAKKLGQEEVNRARVHAREIEEEAHQRGREILLKAQVNANEELGKAKEKLKKDIIKLTMAATEAVLQNGIDKEKQRELISKYIAEAKFK